MFYVQEVLLDQRTASFFLDNGKFLLIRKFNNFNEYKIFFVFIDRAKKGTDFGFNSKNIKYPTPILKKSQKLPFFCFLGPENNGLTTAIK